MLCLAGQRWLLGGQKVLTRKVKHEPVCEEHTGMAIVIGHYNGSRAVEWLIFLIALIVRLIVLIAR